MVCNNKKKYEYDAICHNTTKPPSTSYERQNKSEEHNNWCRIKGNGKLLQTQLANLITEDFNDRYNVTTTNYPKHHFR